MWAAHKEYKLETGNGERGPFRKYIHADDTSTGVTSTGVLLAGGQNCDGELDAAATCQAFVRRAGTVVLEARSTRRLWVLHRFMPGTARCHSSPHAIAGEDLAPQDPEREI